MERKVSTLMFNSSVRHQNCKRSLLGTLPGNLILLPGLSRIKRRSCFPARHDDFSAQHIALMEDQAFPVPLIFMLSRRTIDWRKQVSFTSATQDHESGEKFPGICRM